MKEFWFCLNTKIYFGCGALEKYAGEIGLLGKRVLVVTGRHSAKASGLLGRVEKVLSDKGIKFFEFSEVEENPSFRTLETGAMIARKNNCDCVLGIGGGSPMDAAKGIAILAVNDPPAKQYAGEDKFKNKPLPVMAVPTTAGTGSEITRYAVITDKEENSKKTIASLLIMTAISICDPELTLTLPPRLTASTAMDAISHAIEGYLSNKANPVNDALDLEAIRLAALNLKEAVKNPQNLEARANMLLASLTAGMALNHTGTILGHSMGYALTLDYGLQHGEANGLIIPYLMEHIYPMKKERIDRIGDVLGGTPWKILKQLLRETSLPASLKDIGITDSDVDTLSKRMIENSSRAFRNIDFSFKDDDFKKVVQLAIGV